MQKQRNIHIRDRSFAVFQVVCLPSCFGTLRGDNIGQVADRQCDGEIDTFQHLHDEEVPDQYTDG